MRRPVERGLLFSILQALVDSAAGEGLAGSTISRPQRAIIRQGIEQICKAQLPAPRFIQHEGYVIALEAVLNKLREPAEVVPVAALAARARRLPNLSDRVYVLGLVGANARSSKERHACFDEAKQVADDLPMLPDRIGRLQTLSELCTDLDVQRSKELLREAVALSYQGTGESFEERRESLLASARRISPEFASSIATLSDDDPAKKHLARQLDLYQKWDSFVEKRHAPPDLDQPATLQDARMFWMLLGSLNAGTVTPAKPEKALVALRNAAEFPISDAYPFFAWFLENAVRGSYNDADVRDYIIPLYEACLRGAELAMHAAAGAPAAAQRMLAFAKTADGEASTIVGVGERSEGIQRLRDWLHREQPKELFISETYFGPDSVQLLALIVEASPECQVVLIAGKKESQSGITGSVAEAYRSAWARQFAMNPPEARLIFAETRKSRKFPVHDRWWLTDGAGVDLGTSYNGIGARLSSVRPMIPGEVDEARQKLSPYFAQSRVEMNGERLDYESFTLPTFNRSSQQWLPGEIVAVRSAPRQGCATRASCAVAC